jgi:hypothetical protein
MRYVSILLLVIGFLVAPVLAQPIGTVIIDRTNDTIVVNVTGTADAATDTANFQIAVDLLNAEDKGGTIGINGIVVLNQNFDLTKSISILGTSPDAEIRYAGSGGTMLSWNETWSPRTETGTQFDIVATGGDGKVTVSSGTAPARGDWVVIWSDDQITGAPPHFDDPKAQCPEEMHQVEYVQDDSSAFWVSGFVVDTMSAGAAAQGVVIPSTTLDQDIVIDKVKFGQVAGNSTSDFSYIMKFTACENITITDSVTSTRECQGGVWFQYCANVRCRMSYNGSEKNDGTYATVVSSCNGVVIDGIWRGYRHTFTTASGYAINTAQTDIISAVDTGTETLTTSFAHGLEVGMQIFCTGSLPTGLNTTDRFWVESVPTDTTLTVKATVGGGAVNLTSTTTGGVINRQGRWGTPIGVITEGPIYISPKVNEASGAESNRTSWDTHAEGYGVICRNDFIMEGGTGGDIAANVRSRGAQFQGCTFKGIGGGSNGIQVTAADVTISNCTFEGNWRGVLIQDVGAAPDDVTISNCLFKDNTGYSIWQSDGDNLYVLNNSFRNAAYTRGNSPFNSKSLLRISGGTGHRVHGNVMQKDTNDHVIDIYQLDETDIDVTGNVATGYGSGVVGFGRILPIISVDTGAETMDVTGAHGFASNDRVRFTTTGSLPGGLSPATDYYVISGDTNTFGVSVTPGPGGAVNLTSAGSDSSVENGGVNTIEAAYDGVNTIDE